MKRIRHLRLQEYKILPPALVIRHIAACFYVNKLDRHPDAALFPALQNRMDADILFMVDSLLILLLQLHWTPLAADTTHEIQVSSIADDRRHLHRIRQSSNQSRRIRKQPIIHTSQNSLQLLNRSILNMTSPP